MTTTAHLDTVASVPRRARVRVVVLAIPIGSAPIGSRTTRAGCCCARHGRTRALAHADIRGAPNEGMYKPQLFGWSIALASLPSGQVTSSRPLPCVGPRPIAGVAARRDRRALWSVSASVMASPDPQHLLPTTLFAHHPLALTCAFIGVGPLFLFASGGRSANHSVRRLCLPRAGC